MLYRLPPIIFGNIPDRPPLLYSSPKQTRYTESLNPIKLYNVRDFNKLIHSRLENPHSILTPEQVTRIIKHGPVSGTDYENTTWEAQSTGDEYEDDIDWNLLPDATWEDYSDTESLPGIVEEEEEDRKDKKEESESDEDDDKKEEGKSEDADAGATATAATTPSAVVPIVKTPRRRKLAGAAAGASPVKAAKLKHATAAADAEATRAPKKDSTNPHRTGNNDYRNPDPVAVVAKLGLTIAKLPTTAMGFAALSVRLRDEANFKIRSKETTSVDNIRKHFIKRLFMNTKNDEEA